MCIRDRHNEELEAQENSYTADLVQGGTIEDAVEALSVADKSE